MADYDRYDTRSWDRNRSGGATRDWNRDDDRGGERSIFSFGGGRERDDDRYGRGGDRGRSGSLMGGGAAAGAYDRGRDDDWRGQAGRGGGREERHYGPDDTREGIARDETGHLIASNKVEGTAVYGRNGERLGDIYNFMVDKRSGKVEYAVMSYGGFLGMGSRYYPLPWDMLTYDTRQGGYRVELTERDLEHAPSFDRNSEPDYDRRYSGRVHDYYGIRY